MVLKLNSLHLRKEVRLTGNDRKVLKILLKNSRAKDVEIGQRLSISPQAAFKIRRKLEEIGLIRKYATEVDHSKLGVRALALVLLDLKKSPEARYQDLMQFLSKNLLHFSKLLISGGSHAALFGFEDMQRLYKFFDEVQYKYSDFISLKNIYTLHAEGMFKNSSKDLFYNALSEWGRETVPFPPKLANAFEELSIAEPEHLSLNEKKVLQLFLDDGRGVYKQFSEREEEVNLSDRGICKIKERLEKKAIIKGYTVELDYSLLGINVFALVFLERDPSKPGLKQGLCKWAESAHNVLGYYQLNENSLHAVFCGFRNLGELERYWSSFEGENGDLVKVKHIYISSNEGNFSPQMKFYNEVLA